MKRSGQAGSWLVWYAGLCVLCLLVSLVHLLSPVLVANVDDADFLSAVSKPEVREALVGLDFSLGRFYAELKFTLLGWAYLCESPWWIGGWRLGIACLQLSLGGLLVSDLLGDRRWGLLFALLLAGSACYVPTYHLLVSYPQVGLGLVFVEASWLLWLRGLRLDSPACRGGAMAFLALSLLMHEVFLCFLSVHVLLALRESRLHRLRHLWAPLLIALAYGLLFLATARLGRLGGASYGGTELNWNLPAILWSMAVQGLSSLPGAELLIDRAAVHFLAAPSLRCIDKSTTLDWLLGAGAGLVSLGLLTGLWRGPGRRTSLLGVLVCASLGFMPSLLISLTPKYQEWSHHRIFPYIYAAFGTGFFILALLWFLSWAGQSMARRAGLLRLASWLFALGLCFIVVASRSISRRSVEELGKKGTGVAHSWATPRKP
jgi:hypothetical protein